MKRELKIKYADLRQVGERVNVVKYALEEIEEAAERFERLLGEQESEAVTALLELRRSRLKKDVQACHDHLEALYELLSGYITEMTAVVKPIDEEQEMVVDRNDIWWNMEQIHGNIEESNAIVNELALLGYREETVVRQPQIREEMEAEEVSALWEAYHREFEARERRRENYRKLQGFCQGEARRAKGRLEALYEEIP